MAEDPQKKELESMWKKFSDVISFMYDNEGVIKSLKNEMKRTGGDMKKTLKGQMNEVHHLIIHHQKDLSTLVDKAQHLAKAKGAQVGKTCESLKKAIDDLDIDQMKKNLENLKKELT